MLERSAEFRAVASSAAVRGLVEPVVGGGAFAVRATLFDKTPEANWKVPWHQDLTIAVAQRIDTPGFTAWSVKDGVYHVQPPSGILEGMLAVRIHLDDCGEDNGPLRVIPGSHRHGRLADDQIERAVASGPRLCARQRRAGRCLCVRCCCTRRRHRRGRRGGACCISTLRRRSCRMVYGGSLKPADAFVRDAADSPPPK